MRTVGRLANRLLDAALPARCPGCGAEGPPLCTSCATALDARLDLPAGIAIGLPSDVPAPLHGDRCLLAHRPSFVFGVAAAPAAYGLAR